MLSVLFVASVLVISSCSSMGAINTLISHKELKEQKQDIELLYKKYNYLLTAAEKAQVEHSYSEIVKAGENLSIETPINYLVAKESYQQLIPLFAKYKEKIDPIDRVKILAIHNKLKLIAKNIDEAIEKGTGRNSAEVGEYINTAVKIIKAFR